MKTRKHLLWLMLILNILISGINASDITVPDSFKDCSKQISVSLANCTNSEVCKWTLDAVGSVLTCIPSEAIDPATICEYGSTASWIYLAGRCLVKRIFPSISIDDSIRSLPQRFLSSDITALLITIPSALSLAQLAGWKDMPSWVNYLVSFPPFAIGGLQLLFDACKGIRGIFRSCFGCCMPSKEDIAEKNKKFRKILTEQEVEIHRQVKKIENDPLQQFLVTHKKELKRKAPPTLSKLFDKTTIDARKALILRQKNKYQKEKTEIKNDRLWNEITKQQFIESIDGQITECDGIIDAIGDLSTLHINVLKLLLKDAVYEYDGIELQDTEVEEVSSSSSTQLPANL